MATIWITPSYRWILGFNPLHPTLNVSYNGKNAIVSVPNLSSGKKEAEYRWYFEEYVGQDPFLSSRATSALENLKAYGVKLADAIVGTGLVPEDILEQGIEIQIEDDLPAKSTLYHLHWEILEWIDLWRVSHPPKVVTVTRSCRQIEKFQPANPPLESFRVLVLAARPNAGNDVPHRLVSRIIQNVIDEIQLTPRSSAYKTVTMDIVSPGTLELLQEWLGDTDKGKGYYNLVHLDVHGHEIKSQSLLAFLPGTSETGEADWVSGDQLARIFRDAGVSRVFMSACGSARSAKASTNIATSLIRGGVSEVIGMSFKVTASAVEIFTFEAYKALLMQGCSLHEAAARGRRSLRECTARMTKFGHSVEAVDSPIPVCYTWNEAGCRMSYDMMEVSQKIVEADTSLQEMTLLGREEDILDLESAFLSENPVTLLVGQAGIGKTDLLKHLHWWWEKTSIVKRSAYIDLPSIQPWSLEQLENTISAQLNSNSKDEKDISLHTLVGQDRYLLIFDGMESLSLRINRRQRGNLVDFLERLRDAATSHLVSKKKGNSLILIASRKDEPWLRELDQKEPRLLRGLKTLHGVQLASKLSSGLLRSKVETREDFEYLERIVRLLNGNPLALQLVMRHAATIGMLPKACYDSLLRGDPITLDKDWISTTEGARGFVEVCNKVKSPGDSSTLQFYESQNPQGSDEETIASRSTISFNPISLLPMFWDAIERKTLPLYFRLWVLHKIRSDTTKYSPDEFAAKPCVLYSTVKLPYGEVQPELEEIVEALVTSMLECGLLEELGRDQSTVPGNSYYRMNPLLVLALRQGEYYDRLHRSITETAMVSYHSMRTRAWVLERHATLSYQLASAMELNKEFSNFLVAGRMLHQSGIHTLLDISYLSNIVEPLIERGHYLGIHRFPLLIELAQNFQEQLLDVLDNDAWNTSAMASESEYLTKCMPETSDDELSTDWAVFLTKISWRMHTLTLTVHLNGFHDYLAARTRYDYEAILLRISNYSILEDSAMPTSPLSADNASIVIMPQAMFDLYGSIFPRRVSDQIRPAGDNRRVEEAYSRFEQQLIETASESSDEPMISEMAGADEPVLQLDDKLLVWGYPGVHEYLDELMWTYINRGTSRWVMRVFVTRDLSTKVYKRLDEEVIHLGNQPKNICVLLECLAILDAANGNWSDAVAHLQSARDHEDSIGMELSLQRSSQRDIRMADALDHVGDRQAAYRLLEQVFEQENSERGTPETFAAAALSFARTRIACLPDGPISALLLLIRAAKAAYCGPANSTVKEGYFLKELLRISKEQRWWYEWRVRRYKNPCTTVNFNLSTLFSLRIYFNIVFRRLRRVGILRRNQPDPYAASDEVLAEAEQHLFSSPGQNLQENHFHKDTFRAERALFHHIYECSTNFPQYSPAESYPTAPFVATDGAVQTTPPDYHFPMQPVMSLAGYSPCFDAFSPALEVRTSFTRIICDYLRELWATGRRSARESERATYRFVFLKMLAARGYKDDAEMLALLSDEDFDRVVRQD